MKYLTNTPPTTEKMESNLFKNDYKLIFDKNFSPHINSELELNSTEFHLKRFFLLWIEHIIEIRNNFPHISEICFTTFSHKRYMT